MAKIRSEIPDHTAVDDSVVRISPMVMTTDRIRRDLAVPDLTDTKQSGVNPVNLVMEKIFSVLKDNPQNPPLVMHRDERIVNVADNFDNLLIPPEAPSRLPQYARYIDEKNIFRTHTSAMIPPVLREVAKGDVHPDDFIVACPGITFRRDVIDARHTDTPHQLDIWRIKKMQKGEQPITGEEPRRVVTTIVQSLTPNPEIRFNPTSHPYTQNGFEVEVKDTDGSWLEIMEAGELNTEVLRRNGVPEPNSYTGFAMGMGLDRLAMYAKRMKDIRNLRSESPQIKRQMNDLEPFVEVSRKPPLKRKVSLVSASAEPETLAETLRDMDPTIFSLISELKVVGATPVDSLNDAIRTRLGANPGVGQINLLLEIDVNPIDHSANDDEANQVVLATYNALNETKVPLPPFKEKSKKN